MNDVVKTEEIDQEHFAEYENLLRGEKKTHVFISQSYGPLFIKTNSLYGGNIIIICQAHCRNFARFSYLNPCKIQMTQALLLPALSR